MCAFVITASAQVQKKGSGRLVVPQTAATVIVLLAHPDIRKSTANAALSKTAADVEGVQVINIYDYPVAPDVYRECISRAKTIVYEFPFYWMSSPHLLKQWIDEVFMEFTQENAVKGKRLMVVTTTGSEEAAYRHDGRNKYTMDEYLRPFEGQANHAGMIWEKPLVVYGQGTADAARLLESGCREYRKRLEELVKE